MGAIYDVRFAKIISGCIESGCLGTENNTTLKAQFYPVLAVDVRWPSARSDTGKCKTVSTVDKTDCILCLNCN